MSASGRDPRGSAILSILFFEKIYSLKATSRLLQVFVDLVVPEKFEEFGVTSGGCSFDCGEHLVRCFFICVAVVASGCGLRDPHGGWRFASRFEDFFCGCDEHRGLHCLASLVSRGFFCLETGLPLSAVISFTPSSNAPLLTSTTASRVCSPPP